MASKSEFDTAAAAYSEEIERVKSILEPLVSKIQALDVEDPDLPNKIPPLNAEYKDFRDQVNPQDAVVKQRDREMVRIGNQYKDSLTSDDEKIAVIKDVQTRQKALRDLVPQAKIFTDTRKSLQAAIDANPAKYGQGDGAATSEQQESDRVAKEKAQAEVSNTGGAAPAPTGVGESGSTGSIKQGSANPAPPETGGATVNVGGPSVSDLASTLFNLKTFSLSKPAGGPPYENVLEQFASYAPVWTMAALTPNQFNNPSTYRGKPAALKNIVFSSGGRYDGQRVQTEFGAPEYYVNNFEFITTAGASPKAGNSNVQNISFDLYEPYSMGLFLQSCLAAALDSGYTSYNECPYLLKLEFLGYKQDGSILNSSELLAKYFVVQLNDVNFSVTEAGSQYKVKCHPYNHAGFSNVVTNLPNDVTIKIDGQPGEDTSKLVYLLSKGENSLCAALNKIQENLVKEKQQLLADRYEIVFPVNWTDTVGLSPESSEEQGLAFFKITNDDEGNPLPGIPQVSSTEFGDGEIGQATPGFDSTKGGNYNFSLAGDAVDPATGVIKRDALTIDPKQRTFTFPQGTPIQQVIAQMVVSSEYATRAINPDNIDKETGMINWFRVDSQIQLGAFDTIRNVRQRKYIYRVMPYKVHSSVFTNSSAAPPGYTGLKKVCAKEYDYFYTGQNNSVLKFDIQIASLFHNMKTVTPPQQNSTVVNPDLQTPAEENPDEVAADSGNNAGAQGGMSARPTKSNVQATKDPVKAGWGGKSVEQIVATVMHNAILDKGGSAGDLVRINFEILGDPYYLVDQGMGNYLGEAAGGPYTQITADQTMNYQGTDSFLNIVFRTPIEPNLGTSGEGGLYKFPNNGAESPFSGIYQVVKITNRFQDGLFKQQIEANRMPLQPSDFPDGYTPTWKNPFIYSKPAEGPTRGNVVDSNANGYTDLRTPEEIAASDDLRDFYG